MTISGVCTSTVCFLRSSFTGKERDSESGNDYFGARYYASSMGRFMSPDWSESPVPVPYGDLTNPPTLNLYGYTANDPLSNVDPAGHVPCNGVASVTITVTPNGSSISQSADDCPTSADLINYDFRQMTTLLTPPKQPNPQKPTDQPAHNPPITCVGTAGYSGCQPGLKGGALGFHPTSGGLAYGGYNTFGISKSDKRTYGWETSVDPSGLNDKLAATDGPQPPFTLQDIGDKNIQNAPYTRFDIYGFPSRDAADQFGKNTGVPTTITIPDLPGAHCPAGFVQQ